MTTSPDLATIDALLGRAETAASTMVANLLALDENPAFTLIRHTTFDGVTAARHGAAIAEAPHLWERASAFRATVAEARRLRDADRRPDADRTTAIGRLLTGPVVVEPAATTGSGLTGRTLFGTDAPTGVRLDDLAATLDTQYRAVAEAVRSIDAAWQTQLPQLQALVSRLGAAEQRARDLGVSDDPTVAGLAGLGDRARASLAASTTDPVGQADVGAALTAEATAIAARLDELGQRRARLGDELAAARQELVALRLLVTAGARAHERAVAKVREPVGLREPVAEALLDGPDGLEAELDRVERGAERPWTQRWSALDRWTERARALRATAEAALRANEAPVAARDELRGRLESYRAMAGAHGAAEDAELRALHDRAHTALHEAPADLHAAAPALVRYVAAVRAHVQSAGRKGTA